METIPCASASPLLLLFSLCFYFCSFFFFIASLLHLFFDFRVELIIGLINVATIARLLL